MSAYLIWNDKGSEIHKATALKLYFLQLAVNFSWSIIFFRLRLLKAAAIVAVVLLVLVIIMVLSFKKINKTAAWMNIPYLIWLIFASYLAIAAYILN
jgi:tryptophan-rich sensory protein